MSYDYSENILVQESAGHLLQNELGWEVAFAYNKECCDEISISNYRQKVYEYVFTRYKDVA